MHQTLLKTTSTNLATKFCKTYYNEDAYNMLFHGNSLICNKTLNEHKGKLTIYTLVI